MQVIENKVPTYLKINSQNVVSNFYYVLFPMEIN